MLGLVSGATSALGQAVDFESQIKPLLSDRCFACHGPDENARKADLQLHTREGAFAKLDDDLVVITPGKPQASELYRRITATDPDDLMPPPESKRKLSARGEGVNPPLDRAGRGVAGALGVRAGRRRRSAAAWPSGLA